jgi:protein-L-isoaspartate(D-aspartate) O-methyltransferase
VLATLAHQVFAVEIVPGLAAYAAQRLAARGYANVTVGSFDGGAGWPEHAPYDAIIVSAAAPRIPPLLVDQLADGGRLIIPIGPHEEQTLAVVRRVGNRYETFDDTRCRYVDLQGRFGVGSEPPLA